MAIPNPIVIRDMVNQMESDPTAEIDLTGAPEGTEDAIYKEISRREQNKKAQAVIDSEPPEPARPDSNQENPFGFMAPNKPIGAVGRGVLRGVSYDFADELGGVGNAVMETIKNPGISGQDTIKAYKSGRDAIRDDFKESADAQPVASTVGMIGGGLLAPGKFTGPAPVKGAKAGALYGIGGNEDPSKIEEDTLMGAGVGGVLGAAGDKIAGWGKGIAQSLKGSADDLLAAALKIPKGSKEFIELKASGLLDDVLARARQSADEAGFPYSAGKMRMNIEEPAIANAKAGTVVNPELEVPNLSGPNSLDAAYTSSYMRPATRPAPNQMPFEDRVVSQQLGKVVDKQGSGLMPSTGLQPSTATGGIMSAVMTRGEMIGGIGFNKIANKMTDILEKADLAAGASQMGTGKLAQLLKSVLESEAPELEDYLAQEMSPEYKALRMEAADAAGKEE